jgi:excisionase family DNA binding protein
MAKTPKNFDPAQPKPQLPSSRPRAASTAKPREAQSAKQGSQPGTRNAIVGRTTASRNSNSSKRKAAKLDADDYTVEQIADLLNCSTKTVRRRIKARALRADRDGQMVRISIAEYLRYRAKRNPAI